ncbi:MAG: phosphate signaling complex protein PhoU, partial [Anaerolineae bacterium]
MSIRSVFDQELQTLRDDVLRLGSMVDEAIGLSIQALKTRDQPLARRIVADDEQINELRFKIEEGAVSLIARQQPNASDLRFTVGAISIALELERMADHAAGIATIVVRMGDEPLLKPLIDLPRMAQIAREMLRASLDALTQNDAEAALAVTDRDDEVDDLYNQIFREIISYILEDPQAVTRAMYLLFCAHNVERIADRVTNICERVDFIATGRLEEIPSSAGLDVGLT